MAPRLCRVQLASLSVVGGAWIVGLRGEHELSTQPMLTRHLRGLGRTGDGLVVDLAHVEFIDSTVIGALLGAYKGPVARRRCRRSWRCLHRR